MKKAVSILVLILLGVHFHGAAVLWTVYYGCSDWIAATYCVNPQSDCCKGKCHIVKVDKEQHTANKGGFQQENQTIQLAPPAHITEVEHMPGLTQRMYRIDASAAALKGFLRLPDQPPRV